MTEALLWCKANSWDNILFKNQECLQAHFHTNLKYKILSSVFIVGSLHPDSDAYDPGLSFHGICSGRHNTSNVCVTSAAVLVSSWTSCSLLMARNWAVAIGYLLIFFDILLSDRCQHHFGWKQLCRFCSWAAWTWILQWMVVPFYSLHDVHDCGKMKLLYDYITWISTSDQVSLKLYRDAATCFFFLLTADHNWCIRVPACIGFSQPFENVYVCLYVHGHGHGHGVFVMCTYVLCNWCMYVYICAYICIIWANLHTHFYKFIYIYYHTCIHIQMFPRSSKLVQQKKQMPCDAWTHYIYVCVYIYIYKCDIHKPRAHLPHACTSIFT